ASGALKREWLAYSDVEPLTSSSPCTIVGSLLSSTKSHKSYAPPSKQSSSTRSHASTKYKGKKIAKPITPPSESASEEDSDPKQAQRDKDMQKNLALIAKTVTVAGARETVDSQVVQQTGIQCFNCMEFGHFAKECMKPKREKRGTSCDWLEDTDEEIDEQELEAHYSYMAKIQEVPTADSGTDTEPLEQWKRMIVIVIPDSPNMCNNDIQSDQDAEECDDELY
ncbi:retrovirus-related pol polyprotein from transposon TNT 1-94, partial [Tanacetum coccineum]